jgi:hypothetical protein
MRKLPKKLTIIAEPEDAEENLKNRSMMFTAKGSLELQDFRLK